MRTLEDHKVGGLNEALTIEVTDEPGPGGANHRYVISGFEVADNPSAESTLDCDPVSILFQNGPLQTTPNGITNEALLAIVIDRLRGFQKGPDPVYGLALRYAVNALDVLNERTRDRLPRGMEGTNAT